MLLGHNLWESVMKCMKIGVKQRGTLQEYQGKAILESAFANLRHKLQLTKINTNLKNNNDISICSAAA